MLGYISRVTSFYPDKKEKTPSDSDGVFLWKVFTAPTKQTPQLLLVKVDFKLKCKQ